ncbi:MAG: ATP-binding cassette domain-containing protein, partial [Pseudomonadota bacterium]
IKRLQASAHRLAMWGKTYDNEDLARKAKTIQRRVEKLQQEQTTVSRGSALDLHVQTESLRAKSLLTIEHLQIFTPDNEQQLLTIEFQHIRPGDRIALLGRNGAGKSTTINRLINAIGTDDPQIKFNPNVNPGYYDQELSQFQTSQGRMEWLRQRCEHADVRLKQVLLRNGISYRDFDQPVDTLSGGQCARLMFMLFQLNQPNFLVLDEPTNHIDIQGREQLELQLIESEATLLVTSHDRRFVERVANRWWWINNCELIELNSLDDFYDAIKQDALPQNAPAPLSSNTTTQTIPTLDNPDDKLNRIETLEKLLREDKARKPKFQKPARQQAWEKEIALLWKDLE